MPLSLFVIVFTCLEIFFSGCIQSFKGYLRITGTLFLCHDPDSKIMICLHILAERQETMQTSPLPAHSQRLKLGPISDGLQFITNNVSLPPLGPSTRCPYSGPRRPQTQVSWLPPLHPPFTVPGRIVLGLFDQATAVCVFSP